MDNEKKEAIERRIVDKIAAAKLGFISYTARVSIQNCKQSEFLKEMYDQLTIHDPVSTLKKLGNDLATEIINHYEG